MVIGSGVLLAAVGLTALIGRSSSRQSPPPSAPSAPAANPRAGKNETKNAVAPPPPVKVEELPAASPKIVAQATQRIEKKAEVPSSFPEEILEIEGRRIAVAKRLLCWQSREDLAALREHVAIPGMTWERFFREFGWQAFSGPSGRWLGNDKLVPYIDSSGDKNTLFCVSYDLAPSLIRGTKLWGRSGLRSPRCPSDRLKFAATMRSVRGVLKLLRNRRREHAGAGSPSGASLQKGWEIAPAAHHSDNFDR